MSCAVEEEARTVAGKKAIAVEAFGRALRQIPTILADNAGYDSSDLVSKLRAAHYEGQADAGLGEFRCASFLHRVFIRYRYERGIDWINDEARCYRKLQVETSGCLERK